MSRWGKNIVVPLDSLCKEKENTNRPTVARSVGTVGKWGKMGFTSTRTYALTALPPAVAAAAAAAATAASAGESPASLLDDDLSPSVPEPPKPKKFFKSRNTAPPEVIAQMIQQLPRLSTSPVRDLGPSSMAAPPSVLGTPTHSRESIKLKLPKSNSAERKKKSPKKAAAATATKAAAKCAAATSDAEEAPPKPAPDTPKPAKKKKEEKKLKPEAPPSRIIARARKTVNYAEYDDDERMPTPVKDMVAPKTKPADEPPPENAASKTPEHPPIVLRISKGTSRLVSTDSDEQALPNAAALPTQYSPHQNDLQPEHNAAAPGDIDATAGGCTPKIIVKPPRPPSPEQQPALPAALQSQPTSDLLLHAGSYSSEINYSTVKISPDKPPKERLKLIIKGDVIRNAIAAAEAAAAAKAAAKTPEHSAADGGNSSSQAASDGVRPEKEKKTKSKKHKHAKHEVPPAVVVVGGNQLRPSAAVTACGEFKTPSPHLALGGSGGVACHTETTPNDHRTIISPPALSERDFDSQSSVLGSISSKGNSTPHLAPAANEESCVVHSRGSSVITSDLETSQHSSLVAPPSDIESRLESMMMDDEVTQRPLTLATQEPLQEDILAVLQGDESQAPDGARVNGVSPAGDEPADEANGTSRRVTRGRNRGAKTVNYSDEPEEPAKVARTRGKKQVAAAATPVAAEEPAVPKRTRGRGAKKAEEDTPMETEASSNGPETSAPDSQALTAAEPSAEEAEVKQAAPRRGRLARNVGNNNNLNNNNINKIAANLSAKAGAAVEALSATPAAAVAATTVAAPAKAEPAVAAAQPRIYGRKRKNQQVMHLVPTAADEADEEQPARKLANLQDPHDETDAAASGMLGGSEPPFPADTGDYENGPHPADEHHAAATTTTRPPSVTPSSPPPQRDYKVKDKFKRTLTLDNQANNCNAMVVATSSAVASTVTHESKLCDSEDDHQRASVKLVISKKKGSIFKSRALPVQSAEQAPSMKRHLYKHRWDAEANGGISSEASAAPASANEAPAPQATRSAAADNIFDDFGDEAAAPGAGPMRDNISPPLGKLTRVVKPNPQVYANPFDMDEEMGGGAPDTITSVKVDRKAKDFYTVVRNVKTAHQIQEIGENQEMDDDAEYILDALQPHNPIPTRCLSALQLATKCMTAAFRMHVRAHGVVAKFFKALSDANTDLSLGLCTSAIMYILSQEGLNMDLDRDSLELMMNLLECETKATPSDRANYERNRQKVRELCEEMKAQGKATHLNMDSITVGRLAMETLLSLTSKRAGEWFKDELRELGGLEHIIKTISDCCRPIMAANEQQAGVAWSQALIDNTQTVERCMRVLENVTQMNEENQKYMLTYAQGAAIDTLCTLFALCDRELRLHPTTEASARDNPGVVVRELLIPLMKVLTNLTHTFNPAQSTGAAMLGKRTAVIETSFNLLMQTTQYIPDRNVFELSMLSLLLLINLTMHTMQNRTIVMNSYALSAGGNQHNEQQGKVTAVQAIMDYFYKCEELAKLVEKNTDAYLDNTEKNKKKQEEVDETVNNLLQKAGHHMEHTLKGSYAGILVGHLITDSEEYESIVRTHLRGNGFKEIIAVLEKYHTFMNLTASSEATVVAHIKSTKKLIDYFKKRDLLHEMNDSNDCGHPLNLEKHNSHNSDDESSKEMGGPSQRVYKTYSQR